jgi:hypothetical protein
MVRATPAIELTTEIASTNTATTTGQSGLRSVSAFSISRLNSSSFIMCYFMNWQVIFPPSVPYLFSLSLQYFIAFAFAVAALLLYQYPQPLMRV